MQVILAGYNVDAEVLAELTRGQSRQDVTPEIISASYARISRDPRSITVLRADARKEVEKWGTIRSPSMRSLTSI
jgi:hypothetical protein